MDLLQVPPSSKSVVVTRLVRNTSTETKSILKNNVDHFLGPKWVDYGTYCKPDRSSTLSDTVSKWTVAIKKFHVTTVAKSFCFKTIQSQVFKKNKEDVDRFGPEALGSSAVFAKSVSVRFSSIQIIGALVGQKEAT
ncbi:hypothetical protein KIN20_020429 [Parelaphostrongylus tenuis]|uniref:Uncharacterized protein n=1 Tax=Parelaphostrongylus tenuis TaxID=148309 RepID=A0AAD5N9T9_PARTN|nr:hypothetical protein KIN20_020429 [Parelaphostrongylus tenuis]